MAVTELRSEYEGEWDVAPPSDRPSRRTWERRYLGAVLAADLFVLAALRIGIAIDAEPFDAATIGIWPTLAFAATWIGLLAVGDAYEIRRIGVGVDEYRAVIRAGTRLFGILGILLFVSGSDISPAAVVVLVPTLGLLTILMRKVVRRALHLKRDSGRAMSRVLAIGTTSTVRSMTVHLQRLPWAGYRVIGACVPARTGAPLDMPTYETSSADDILDVLRHTGADVLAVVDIGAMPNCTLQGLAWRLERSGVQLIVAPAVTDIAGPRIRIRPVAGLPMLHVEEPRLEGITRSMKHIIDWIVAAVVLVCLLPFVPIVFGLIKLSGPGPVLFRQVRVGKDGRTFTMFKLRTMVDGAEELIDGLRPQNELVGPMFKMRRDPRVTTVGRVLRRLSVDELPQLVNVLRGEMSVVGPRPPLSSEVEKYGESAHRRFLVRPGLTGMWQVSGRADLLWEETVRLDLYYVDNWSPSLDLLIVAKTVRAVVKGAGAY